MALIRMGFNRIPYLGAFALCTDRIALFPARFHFREQEAQNALGVPIIRSDMGRSPLVGILAAGNSRGLICSDLFEMEGEARLAKFGIGIEQIKSKFTAFGNIVLANDRGAIVNPDLPDEVLQILTQKLGTPVKRGTIAGIKNVGAAGVATNRGALLHPDVSESELKLAERVLGVPVEVGTACGGVKFVGLCMVANSNGAVVGMTSTGPELGRIESALGFI
ncbi:MAG: translation initiation factor IF-6 [Hadesarchaea archaeon]|nr:translation initiation factor IF-6 [Hadesarchaea archaeon]